MARVRKATPEQAKVFLKERQTAYRLAFGSPAGQQVLIDLASFCRANESTFHADPRIAAAMDGRREVWLRIAQHCNLTLDQVFNLYSGLPPQLREDDDAGTDDD